jgi:uncharacterized protein
MPRTTAPSVALRRALLPLLVLAVTAALLGAAPVTAAPVPAGYTYESRWYTSHDGIQLHAGVFLPADRAEDEQHPVIMNIGPYTAPNGGVLGANLTGIVDRNPELWDHPAFRDGRYAYVAVDVRGFGGSEGCFEYYMPNEALDAKASIEWAATQPWSTGRVGLWGKSYDAAQQVLALAADPEGLAATVIQAPGLSAYTALWMNGVHYATGRYATTSLYTADDVLPPQNLDTIGSPEYARAALSPLTSLPGNPTCRTDAIVGMNLVRDRHDAFWDGREAYLDAAGSDVPTFWVHGFWDANTKPEHVPTWTSLTGPKQAWFGQFAHIRGHEAGVGRREHFLDEAFRFLDEHVRGLAPAVDDPAVTVQSGNGEQRWRAEAQWPPADADPWSMPVRPGSYRDAPGNEGAGSAAGRGHWTVTPPLPHAAHLAGEPVLAVTTRTVVPYTHLVAHLYDIDPDGRASLVTRGAMATRATGEEEAAFALYPQDWVFEAGHRVAVHLSGSDDSWFSPGLSLTEVAVLDGTLELPLLRVARTAFLEGGRGSGAPAPFPVASATLEAATVEVDSPPAQEPAAEEPPVEGAAGEDG